jgi:HK97 family phage prohead protease
MERRFIPTPSHPVRLETRDNETQTLVGYGALFYNPEDPGTEFQLYSDLKERIMPTAFDRALREAQDVAGLFNHNPDNVLGRISSATMTLKCDSRGLLYSIAMAKTSIAGDVCQHVARGDVKGSSFSFGVRRQMFVAEGDCDVRELHDVDLYDCGPVTFPAYTSTTADLRSHGDSPQALRQAYESWKKEQCTSVTRVLTPRSVVLARARAIELQIEN